MLRQLLKGVVAYLIILHMVVLSVSIRFLTAFTDTIDRGRQSCMHLSW